VPCPLSRGARGVMAGTAGEPAQARWARRRPAWNRWTVIPSVG